MGGIHTSSGMLQEVTFALHSRIDLIIIDIAATRTT